QALPFFVSGPGLAALLQSARVKASDILRCVWKAGSLAEVLGRFTERLMTRWLVAILAQFLVIQPPHGEIQIIAIRDVFDAALQKFAGLFVPFMLAFDTLGLRAVLRVREHAVTNVPGHVPLAKVPKHQGLRLQRGNDLDIPVLAEP